MTAGFCFYYCSDFGFGTSANLSRVYVVQRLRVDHIAFLKPFYSMFAFVFNSRFFSGRNDSKTTVSASVVVHAQLLQPAVITAGTLGGR